MKNVSVLFVLALGLVQGSLASENTSPQQIDVIVSEKGFEPSHVRVDAGRDVLLTITRKTDATCAKSVLIPKLNLKESLPLNKPVILKLGKLEKGEIKFTCGMNMISAVIDVQ